MLTTPANGVLLLSSLSFLTIGIVGWLSVSNPDRSARIWLFAFVIAGITPLLGAGQPMDARAFVLGSTAMALSFALFGLSLKALYNERLALRDYMVALAVLSLVFMALLGYLFSNASIAAQATAFAFGNGAAATWATVEAMNLAKRTRSRFASHLAVIFGIQAAVLALRIPQVWMGEEVRLSENDPLALSIVLALSLCGIVKAISYFALRLEEVRNQVQRDAELVQEQAKRLAQKNSELVSAMHAVPVACVVTDPALRVIYLNAEARRLIGSAFDADSSPRLSDWLIGLHDAQPVAITSARHAFLKTPDSASALAIEISVSGVDSETPGAQWVFLLKPTEHSQSILESIWTSFTRREDRTALIIDDAGRAVSAQAGWGEVLGPYAVFDLPELRFGGITESRDAAGLDLWATLAKFTVDHSQIDRARSEQKNGRGSSLLLRDEKGHQITCSFVPIKSRTSTEQRWLVEIGWKASRPAAAEIKPRPSREPQPEPIRSIKTVDVPEFLKKRPQTD